MFGFPKVDRSIIDRFSQNFIRSLIFQIKFEATNNTIDKKDKICKLYAKDYPIVADLIETGFSFKTRRDQTPLLNPVSPENTGYEVISTDKSKRVTFIKDGITISTPGRFYQTFGVFKDKDIKLLKKSLKQLKISSLNRVAIRKINVIDFEIPPNSIHKSRIGALSSILNPDLLSHLGNFPNQDGIVQNIQNVNYKMDDYQLNLRYGVLSNPNDGDPRSGQIILDIDLFYVGDVQLSTLEELSTDINHEIFNIFIWAMGESAINQLVSK